MNTLCERLADPHGYNKPLFPKAVAELSREEQWEELQEVRQALWCNVWQTTRQMEVVKEREMLLQDSYIAQQANERHNGNTSESLKVISQLSRVIGQLEGKWCTRPKSDVERDILQTLLSVRETVRKAHEEQATGDYASVLEICGVEIGIQEEGQVQ